MQEGLTNQYFVVMQFGSSVFITLTTDKSMTLMILWSPHLVISQLFLSYQTVLLSELKITIYLLLKKTIVWKTLFKKSPNKRAIYDKTLLALCQTYNPHFCFYLSFCHLCYLYYLIYMKIYTGTNARKIRTWHSAIFQRDLNIYTSVFYKRTCKALTC